MYAKVKCDYNMDDDICPTCDKKVQETISCNDGGTTLCDHCDEWFHPAANGVKAHPANHPVVGPGPLECKTCNYNY